MTTLSDRIDPGKLPHVTLTPDEFRVKAVALDWDPKTVLLVLKDPLLSRHFHMNGAMVRVVDKARLGLDFKK